MAGLRTARGSSNGNVLAARVCGESYSPDFARPYAGLMDAPELSLRVDK